MDFVGALQGASHVLGSLDLYEVYTRTSTRNSTIIHIIYTLYHESVPSFENMLMWGLGFQHDVALGRYLTGDPAMRVIFIRYHIHMSFEQLLLTRYN